MSATFAREELELAALLLVVDDDGNFRWSSDKTPELVGRMLRQISYDVSLQSVLAVDDGCQQLADWYKAASAGLEETLRRGVQDLRAKNHSWTEVGKAFGISRQAAWERFRRFDQLGVVDPVEELLEEGATS